KRRVSVNLTNTETLPKPGDGSKDPTGWGAVRQARIITKCRCPHPPEPRRRDSGETRQRTTCSEGLRLFVRGQPPASIIASRAFAISGDLSAWWCTTFHSPLSLRSTLVQAITPPPHAGDALKVVSACALSPFTNTSVARTLVPPRSARPNTAVASHVAHTESQPIAQLSMGCPVLVSSMWCQASDTRSRPRPVIM